MVEQAAEAGQYKCDKCGHDQATTALREVKVVVGWQHTSFLCVAPTYMCQRCGAVIVFLQTEIGRYIDLAPRVQVKSQRHSTLQVVAREPAGPVVPPSTATPGEAAQRDTLAEPIGNTD